MNDENRAALLSMSEVYSFEVLNSFDLYSIYILHVFRLPAKGGYFFSCIVVET